MIQMDIITMQSLTTRLGFNVKDSLKDRSPAG